MFNRISLKSLLIAIIFALASIAGCTSLATPPLPSKETDQIGGRREITFETLAQGESFLANADNPTLFIVNSPREIDPFLTWIDDKEALTRLEASNFETGFVLAVFSGPKGSSGYSIEIQHIYQEADRVRIIAEIKEPPPGQMVSSVITYPYHIVFIRKDNLSPEKGQLWEVYNPQGQLLVQIRH